MFYIPLLFEVLMYMIIPCLITAWMAWRNRMLFKATKIKICVIPTIILFIIMIPVSLMNLYIPSIIPPVLGALLSYFIVDHIHEFITNRL